MISVENTTAEQEYLEQQISAACKENNLSEVLVLLAQAADCNLPRIDGKPLIMWAALEGHIEVYNGPKNLDSERG